MTLPMTKTVIAAAAVAMVLAGLTACARQRSGGRRHR